MQDVDADPHHFAFSDNYEGEMGAAFAVESTKPFSTQDAIIEVNTIHSTSLIHGKPITDNDPNSGHKREASANAPFCVCVDGNGENGGDDGGDNNQGISPTDPNRTPSPGEFYEVQVITDTPYSQVYWYVKAPWETSTYGTNVEIDEGDGTTTEASMSYTFPSGAMHTGEFTITAYIYRDDLSVYEEAYTVNVTSE